MTKIRCLCPPVQNIAEGVTLCSVGAEADVELTHFWQGQIDLGTVEIVISADEQTESENDNGGDSTNNSRGRRRRSVKN